ncbi:uncharacterized protein [Triticum aestivum]|uniref:uncharacterized protein isoform X2 n=1 Tax=Triticum aestivum TaxID=4565 RepID=UPI000842E0F4|nr:uncharacterized protein LOC123184914 isoform X2 [Triticum aestivum]
MHPQAQSPRRISSALTGCISELPISLVENFSSRDKLQQIVTAASTVKDVEHVSAVIHNSSVDPRHASASSHRTADLTCPATSAENTSTAEYESNLSMVDGASATESGKSLQTQMSEGEFRTPRKKESIPLFCSSFTPSCDENFEGLEAVEDFYKSYAHYVGFGVRVGQQKMLNKEVVQTKRFMCSRGGFRTEKNKEIKDPSNQSMKSRKIQPHDAVVMHISSSSCVATTPTRYSHGLSTIAMALYHLINVT